MTDWEAELKRLASGAADVALPNAREIQLALDDISAALKGVVSDGLRGEAGRAATDEFHIDAYDALQLARDVELVSRKVDAANDTRRDVAERELADLNSFPEKLEWWQEAALRTATVGSTWALGPFSFVVADGVVGNINDFLASHRSARAQEGVRRVSAAMDAHASSFGEPPKIEPKGGPGTGPGDDAHQGSDDEESGGSGPGAGDGGTSGSFDGYPGSGTNPLDFVPPGITYNPPGDDTGGTGDTTPTFPNPHSLPERPDFETGGPYPPGRPHPPVWPDRPDVDVPTYPNDPGGRTPHPTGYDPNDPSTWGPGGRHGGVTSDSSMGGGSHGWGSGSGNGRGTSAFGGGIGAHGLGGASGGGLTGAGSAAALGSAGGAVSLAGAKLMQTGGPGMGSGLLGSSGAGASGSGTAGAGTSGARGGSMGMMGGGAAGGGGASEKKSRPGLSGLRAPQLDGDEDPVARSEAAGAGGRDL